jgi:hypothetical protein
MSVLKGFWQFLNTDEQKPQKRLSAISVQGRLLHGVKMGAKPL